MALFETPATPMSPKQVKEKHGEHIPPDVISAVNELLVENLQDDGGRVYASFTQAELDKKVAKLLEQNKRDDSVSVSNLYENGWMNFEAVFRKAGWKVTYDKPGFNETYSASYEFEQKRTTDRD